MKKVMIDTRVPSCPRCSSALDKGIRDNTSYFFCPNCHTEYHVIDEGQAENELLCEELASWEDIRKIKQIYENVSNDGEALDMIGEILEAYK